MQIEVVHKDKLFEQFFPLSFNTHVKPDGTFGRDVLSNAIAQLKVFAAYFPEGFQ